MTSFRDRFFTPKVAEAIMSPLGIVLAGAGAAVGVATGLPLIAAAGIGVAAWGARVMSAVGSGRDPVAPRRNAGELSEPWRSYAVQAERRQAALRPHRRRRRAGPAASPPGRVVGAAWTKASTSRGASPDVATRSSGAIGTIDTESAERELTALRQSVGDRTPTTAEVDTAKSLEAQLASAQRLSELANRSRDRLRLLDARFDELVARTVEVSVGGGDSEGLGQDVDGLVNELEALRMAMEETDRAARGGLSAGGTAG